MAVRRDEGKTTFTRDVLKKNPQGNAKAVNEAWKDAGHVGSISDTLVSKIRSEMKLTGNIRPGRRPAGTNGAHAQPKTSTVVKKAVNGAPERGGGTPGPAATATAPKPRATPGDRSGLLTKLEGEIDDMIFEIKTAGGFTEFEETLRKARRILARSYQE